MARVSYDSAFMKQVVPATSIDYAQDFQVVRDEQSRTLLFSVGSARRLYLHRPQTTNGSTEQLELGPLFGIDSNTAVSHLSILQGSDLTLYIVFVAEGSKAGDPSAIHVVRPTKPTEWLAVDENSKLASWLIEDKSTLQSVVKRVYVAGATPAAASYPTVVVVHARLDGTHIDAACLDIDAESANCWDFSDSFDLPENMDPDGMIAMCAGALPAGINGLFCLYDLQGEVQLTFAGFRLGTYRQPWSTSLRPPPGAQSMATFVNNEGCTDVLVGGTGLFHYTAALAVHSDKPTAPDRFATVLTDDKNLTQLGQLFVAQDGKHLTVYARNGGDTVLYQRLEATFPDFQEAKLIVQGPLVPLLARGDGGGHLAVLVDGATGSQRLFVVGANESLTLMEQSGSTHLWQRIPVLVPSTGKNTDVLSYTSHIRLADANNLALPKTTVLLCSSSAVDVGYNGGVVTLTPQGTPVETDMTGDITLIHSVSSLSSVVFTLKDVSLDKPVLGKAWTVNPAENAQKVLDSITSGDDLKDVTLPNSGKLIDSSKVNPGDLDNAAKAVAQLSASLSRMPKDGSEHVDTFTASVLTRTSYSTAVAVQLGSGEDTDWGFWHFVTSVWDDIESFFVDAFHFVITIAGKVFRFALKGLSYVWKALHWLLQDVLHIPIDKLIEWLGFLFEWDDIKETHNMIVAMANAAIDCAVDKALDFRTVVDGWFDKADDMIKALDTIPPEARDRSVSAQESDKEVKGDETYAKLHSSPGANWSSYQVKHGGVGNSLSALDSEPPGTMDPLVQVWERFKPALEQLRDTVQHAFQNLLAVFTDSKQFSLGQLLTHLGVQLLRDILKVVRDVFDALIELIADFMGDAQSLMNQIIDIPLLSPLYKWMSGNDLSALDAVSLLIAIPTTVLYKAITGKKPAHDLDFLQGFLVDYSSSKIRARGTRGAPRAASITSLSTSSLSAHRMAISNFTLGISDDTVSKIKKIATRLVAIGGPVVSLVLLVLAVDDWYTPDLGVPLAPLTGGIRWGWKVAADVIVSAFTFPYADIPNHPDLLLMRRFSWGLNTLTIPARPAGVRARGIMAIAAGCFKFVPEGVSIPMAVSAAKEITTSDLPSKLEWVDITDRMCSSAFIAAGGVCMIMNEPEPISAGAASVLALTAIGCQTAKAYKAAENFENFPTLSQGSFVGGW
ncbi:hypothetical protein K466DRAFT_569058 [Polyporus arcularius HHB13444]|uniref:Uncharacterized protein n=1 Tax=Polyporus arcularius HHB13444 TaxID=1314778 RepID=A0A5C3NV87_9APHY|nr:hypothetical protein K466DRAFT_569058 [Polyporus arcularius HHB13444]